MKNLILPIGLAALLLAACGKDEDRQQPASQTQPTPSAAQPAAPATSDTTPPPSATTPPPASSTTDSTTTTESTTTTAPPPVAPLTGLRLEDPAKAGRPAMMVKVDNTPRALAVQEGVDRADLVFVEQVEGGTTRLAAVFHSQDATVGPVRSARTSDLHIAANLERPLFVYSGANSGVLREIRRSPAVVDTGIDAAGATAVYQRNQRGSGLLRYFLPTADLYAARQGQGGVPQPLFTYRSEGQQSVGVPGPGAQVVYGGRSATRIVYEWDGAAFLRSQFDRPHVMANGGPRVAPKNVVFLVVPYRNSGYVDSTGNASPEAVLDGSGKAWVLTDGKLAQGSWNRGGPNGRIQLLDGAGNPLALTPGQTWIELAPAEGAIAALPAR